MESLTPYQKIVFGALLLTILTYEYSQVYNNEQSQLYFLPGVETSVSKMNRYLNSHNTTNHLRSYINAYVSNLSPLQIEDIINQMGLSNLTSDVAKKQFLKCAGAIQMLWTLPVHIPKSHQNCKNMSFQSFGPVVALASFPGSGNSWVRQLLETATGIYTGALYCDKSYIKAGMIGEGVATNNVLAIKTHGWPGATTNILNPDKVIYIVRNPFAAILSEENRYLAGVSNSSGDRHTTEVKQDYRNYGMQT